MGLIFGSGFFAITCVDVFLVARWYGIAHLHKEAQKRGTKGASTGRAKGKERQQQKAEQKEQAQPASGGKKKKH